MFKILKDRHRFMTQMPMCQACRYKIVVCSYKPYRKADITVPGEDNGPT